MQQLNEKAMLVGISFSQWSGRTKDNKVSHEIITKKKAEEDSGSWWTYLIPRKTMKRIRVARNRCNRIHKSLTLPWSDSGMRILPATLFMQYRKEVSEAVSDFNTEVEAFLEQYPKIKKNAPQRLRGLMVGKRLPTVQELRGKFGINQQLLPLPTLSDFRCTLTNADIAGVKKQITSTLAAASEKAMSSVWLRLDELIEKVEKTLGQKDKIFRDSLIDNLKEFCTMIPKFNLTDDTKLESVRKELLGRLCKMNPNDMRASVTIRKKAVEEAKKVRDKLTGYSL